MLVGSFLFFVKRVVGVVDVFILLHMLFAFDFVRLESYEKRRKGERCFLFCLFCILPKELEERDEFTHN